MATSTQKDHQIFAETSAAFQATQLHNEIMDSVNGKANIHIITETVLRAVGQFNSANKGRAEISKAALRNIVVAIQAAGDEAYGISQEPVSDLI